MAKATPPSEPAAPPPKSRAKLFLLAGIGLALLGGGGGAGAWYFTQQRAAGHAESKPEPAKPPVFVPLENFVVNLQPENGEQYLQVGMTLQVADPATVDSIKLHMPQVRSRLLLLLSSKKASDVISVEGKNRLAEEVVAQVKAPFAQGAAPQAVSGVFFTAFVVQ